MTAEQIAAALHGQDITGAIQLVYIESTLRRALYGTTGTEAVDEMYGECREVYVQWYNDGDLFDGLWTGVEDVITTLFE
jgi:hypothetical protein